MNAFDFRSMFSSTSAAGAMLRQVGGPVLVGITLAGLGTSTANALPVEIVSRSVRPLQQTSAGLTLMSAERAGSAIAELRRLSGFTWDQLARLFEVSRRSLHFWASGKAMAPANEEHLQRMLATIRRIDRGAAIENRAALLSVLDDGSIPFDLLANGEYDRVVALIGIGQAAHRVVRRELSDEAKAARLPRPPEELVGTLEDRPHREPGVVRAAKSVRTRGDRGTR